MGLGDSADRAYPQLISSLAVANVHIVSVFAGASHSLALSSDGTAFAWGKNNQGQCGLGNTSDQPIPECIEAFRSIEIRQLAGGWEHSLALTEGSRQVFSFGAGYKDSRRSGLPPVLGHGGTDRELVPRVIESLSHERMCHIACGWDHSLAVAESGDLYTWGAGTNGKLGHGDEENRNVPTKVEALSGIIVRAEAGCDHTVAVTNRGELYTWGQGESGRLGHGSTSNERLPRRVDALIDTKMPVLQVAVGDKYNMVLVASDHNPKRTSLESNLSTFVHSSQSTFSTMSTHLDSTNSGMRPSVITSQRQNSPTSIGQQKTEVKKSNYNLSNSLMTSIQPQGHLHSVSLSYQHFFKLPQLHMESFLPPNIDVNKIANLNASSNSAPTNYDSIPPNQNFVEDPPINTRVSADVAATALILHLDRLSQFQMNILSMRKDRNESSSPNGETSGHENTISLSRKALLNRNILFSQKRTQVQFQSSDSANGKEKSSSNHQRATAGTRIADITESSDKNAKLFDAFYAIQNNLGFNTRVPFVVAVEYSTFQLIEAILGALIELPDSIKYPTLVSFNHFIKPNPNVSSCDTYHPIYDQEKQETSYECFSQMRMAAADIVASIKPEMQIAIILSCLRLLRINVYCLGFDDSMPWLNPQVRRSLRLDSLHAILTEILNTNDTRIIPSLEALSSDIGVSDTANAHMITASKAIQNEAVAVLHSGFNVFYAQVTDKVNLLRRLLGEASAQSAIFQPLFDRLGENQVLASILSVSFDVALQKQFATAKPGVNSSKFAVDCSENSKISSTFLPTLTLIELQRLLRTTLALACGKQIPATNRPMDDQVKNLTSSQEKKENIERSSNFSVKDGYKSTMKSTKSSVSVLNEAFIGLLSKFHRHLLYLSGTTTTNHFLSSAHSLQQVASTVLALHSVDLFASCSLEMNFLGKRLSEVLSSKLSQEKQPIVDLSSQQSTEESAFVVDRVQSVSRELIGGVVMRLLPGLLSGLSLIPTSVPVAVALLPSTRSLLLSLDHMSCTLSQIGINFKPKNNKQALPAQSDLQKQAIVADTVQKLRVQILNIQDAAALLLGRLVSTLIIAREWSGAALLSKFYGTGDTDIDISQSSEDPMFGSEWDAEFGLLEGGLEDSNESLNIVESRNLEALIDHLCLWMDPKVESKLENVELSVIGIGIAIPRDAFEHPSPVSNDTCQLKLPQKNYQPSQISRSRLPSPPKKESASITSTKRLQRASSLPPQLRPLSAPIIKNGNISDCILESQKTDKDILISRKHQENNPINCKSRVEVKSGSFKLNSRNFGIFDGAHSDSAKDSNFSIISNRTELKEFLLDLVHGRNDAKEIDEWMLAQCGRMSTANYDETKSNSSSSPLPFQRYQTSFSNVQLTQQLETATRAIIAVLLKHNRHAFETIQYAKWHPLTSTSSINPPSYLFDIWFAALRFQRSFYRLFYHLEHGVYYSRTIELSELCLSDVLCNKASSLIETIISNCLLLLDVAVGSYSVLLKYTDPENELRRWLRNHSDMDANIQVRVTYISTSNQL